MKRSDAMESRSRWRLPRIRACAMRNAVALMMKPRGTNANRKAAVAATV
jgi:hypothetical protein